MAAVHSCDMFVSRMRSVLTEQAVCIYSSIRSCYLVLFQGDVECLQHMSFCIYRPFDIPILPFVHRMHVLRLSVKKTHHYFRKQSELSVFYDGDSMRFLLSYNIIFYYYLHSLKSGDKLLRL